MTIKKTLLSSFVAVFVMSTTVAFSSTDSQKHEYWDRCPTMTGYDFKVMSEGGYVWGRENTYYRAVDKNAEKNMKIALQEIELGTAVQPKDKFSMVSEPFSHVCVYPIQSNGISELWVEMYHVDEPNVTIEDFKKLLKGETLFPGFKFEGKWNESSYIKLDDKRLSIGCQRSSIIPSGTFVYDIVLSYINDMGNGEEKHTVQSTFSLAFDPDAVKG